MARAPVDNTAHEAIAKWTKWVATFTCILAAATILLAIATVISTYYIWGQWKAALEAQADSRELSRASVTFLGTEQAIGDKEGKSINYFFRSSFRNWGTTRTSKFSGWESVKYFQTSIPNSQDFTKPYEKVDNPYNSIIGGNSTVYSGTVSISREDAIAAKNKQGVVVIWGRTSWADIYNPETVYDVNFCLKLIPVSSDGDEHIFFNAIPLKPECNTGMTGTSEVLPSR